MKTMYAITHINKDGMRQLSFANQGRNHYETREGAEAALANLLSANSADTLKMYNDSLEVRPVECYDHGDAVGIYFGTRIEEAVRSFARAGRVPTVTDLKNVGFSRGEIEAAVGAGRLKWRRDGNVEMA